jgi:hypothetical protein
MHVNIAGSSSLAPRPDIPMALDEMIYTATSDALADAGLSINDISGSFMAASDLYDGRAISTMTLTGSTGSFHKNEMRVCNDSLAALMLAAAEIAAGAAEAVIVCTWSKLSDAHRDSILPLALEPVYTRGLNFHPSAILSLRTSGETGQLTTVEPTRIEPCDVAAALIVTAPVAAYRARGSLIGLGAATGRYLHPGEPVLAPVSRAASSALKAAGRSPTEVSRLHLAGLHQISDAEIAAAVGIPEDQTIRPEWRWADQGYAAGLNAVHGALMGEDSGLALVVSGGGLALEAAYAAVVEIA